MDDETRAEIDALRAENAALRKFVERRFAFVEARLDSHEVTDDILLGKAERLLSLVQAGEEACSDLGKLRRRVVDLEVAAIGSRT